MSVLGSTLFFHFRGLLMGRQRNPARSKRNDVPELDIEEWHPIIRSLGLSGRQGRIVELILQGMRDKQIAAELDLSIHTVRTYLNRIFDKVGVDDRFELLLRILASRKSNCGQPRCPYKQ
jgi:DNA-binding CsgD family transcriptional regulator